MTGNCLNHLMNLHIHKESTDNINLVDIANEFYSRKESRLFKFCTFTNADKRSSTAVHKDRSTQT